MLCFSFLSEIPNADLVSECASKVVVCFFCFVQGWLVQQCKARQGFSPLCHRSLRCILRHSRPGPLSHHTHSVLFLEIHFPIPFRFHKVSIAALPLDLAPPAYLKNAKPPSSRQPPKQLPTISFLRRFFTSTSVSPAQMSAAKTKAEQIIDENAVGKYRYLPPFCLPLPIPDLPQLLTHWCTLAVFSKSYCPYCRATKSLLTEMGAKYYTIELDQVGELYLGG